MAAEPITLPIYNSLGEEIERIKLDSSVFDGTVNKSVLYQAINAYLTCQRKGLAATKTRGEVSGGGRKPWRQKGTGRARVGSTRSPLWRHGGVVFGPHPRDFSYKLGPKIKNLALRSGLNVKLKENNFIIIDAFKLQAPKTKDAAQVFTNLKIRFKKNSSKTLLLLDALDDNLKLALANLDFLSFNLAKDTCAYEVLAAKKIVVTKEALAILGKRIKQ